MFTVICDLLSALDSTYGGQICTSKIELQRKYVIEGPNTIFKYSKQSSSSAEKTEEISAILDPDHHDHLLIIA